MYCQKCGKAIPNDSRFCPECGIKQDVILEKEKSNHKFKACNSCGAQIEVDSRFCPECRAQQKIVQIHNLKDSLLKTNKVLSPEEQSQNIKRNKIISTVVGGLTILGLAIGIISLFVTPTINLNKYVSISTEGYDTVGKAVVTFDREKFTADYEKKLGGDTSKFNMNSLSKYMEEEAYFEAMLEAYDSDSASETFLSSCVDGSISNDSGLNNGDVITYTWECNDELALEKYGYKLKYSAIEYTVTGLEVAETFDPFDGLSVIFEGVAPNGRANISGVPIFEESDDLYYSIEPDYGLSNGDTVTLYMETPDDDSLEYCIENYGKIPSSTEKTVFVEGLSNYISSASQISDEGMSSMCALAIDISDQEISNNWDETERIKSFTYIGNYLLSAKDDDDSWIDYQNVLYLIYKVEIENSYSNEEDSYHKTNEIYWYISFNDIVVAPEGTTIIDLTDYDVPYDNVEIDSGVSSGWFGTVSWYYNGYETLEDLYQAAVMDNADSYDCEDNIDEGIEIMEVSSVIKDEDDIIFPDSSEKIISEDDINALSDEELRYAINEIYARHGYIFNDESLREYYQKYDWYMPSVTSEEFSLELFNEIEVTNIETLQAERDDRDEF